MSDRTPSETAVAAVRAATPGWTSALIDTTGRNQLLYCRPTGKLLLADAEPAALRSLLGRGTVRLSSLFPDPAEQPRAMRTARSLRYRIRLYDEERGIHVGRLACGFLGWTDARSRTPHAPVLLRRLDLTQPVPGSDDLALHVDATHQFNPVLLHVLRTELGLVITDEQVEDIEDAANDAPEDPATALAALGPLLAGQLPGHAMTTGLLAGVFQYHKLPMVLDLQGHAQAFAGNPLVAALAGDPAAIDALRSSGHDPGPGSPEATAPSQEFLVLDADPSQEHAIGAALGGRTIVVQGPPGTGKSQTISNLISSLAARGRTVLFVAEKRAAIDAVLRRLDHVGLGGIAFDLHDGATDKTRITAEISAAVDTARGALDPALDQLHARLVRSRATLREHDEALHQPRQPWGWSAFDIRAALLGLPGSATTGLRLSPTVTRALAGDARDEVRDALAELADLGGLLSPQLRGAWAGAAGLRSQADAATVFQLCRSTQALVEPFVGDIQRLAAAAGLPAPGTPASSGALLALAESTSRALDEWTDEALDADLDALVDATGDRWYRKAHGLRIGWRQRRAAAASARALRAAGDGDRAGLHEGLTALRSLRRAWSDAAPSVRPTVPPGLPEARAAHDRLVPALRELATSTGHPELASGTWDQVAATLADLAADPAEAARAGRINELTARLAQGAPGVVDILRGSLDDADTATHRDHAVAVLDHVWLSSIMTELTLADPRLGIVNGSALARAAAEFTDADLEHRDTTPARVLRQVAERFTYVRDEHPDQDRFLGRELVRRRRVKPLRQLLAGAPDVLLAVKPCWAMSPVVVSQVLPGIPGLFDVVVFDEASQVRPADAIPALARARSAVVAGDSQQLPPTTFFDELHDGDDVDDALAAEVAAEASAEAATAGAQPGGTAAQPVPTASTSYTAGMESLLDSMNSVLGDRLADEYYLGWHYRSADARLIGFSNAWFYRNRLVTFPGTAVEPPLRFVHVPQDRTDPGPSNSATAEVERVVDLVLEHADQRPAESLGVIAMGLAHATRIEDALSRRLGAATGPGALRDFFAESAREPFFVKNLERVQGDERDRIILTTGYAMAADGRMRYQFGPVNLPGGQRRLNVAVTRARRAATMVSSFRARDMDPDRLSSDGPRALRAYLAYAESGGTDVGTRAGADTRALNPLEQDLRRRLEAAGLVVRPLYGVAGYFLDLAVAHPDRPEQMVVAVETDGPTYHASGTVRARERLRPEHLERLGWRFHRVWSGDYVRDPDGTVQAIARACGEAVDPPGRSPSTAVTRPMPQPPATRPAGPPVEPGLPIGQYSDAQLRAVVRWVSSDGLVRTQDELLKEVMRQLGFKRRGSVIVRRISAVIGSAGPAA